MKMNKKSISAVFFILVALIVGADSALGLDILNSLMESDSTAPEIITENAPTIIYQDGVFDITTITCVDDVDTTCDVIIVDTIDTSILGEQQITIKATDSSNNTKTIIYTFQVITKVTTGANIPAGYYDSISGLTGEELKAALNDIITNHTEYPYTSSSETDVWDILREADEDPNNPDNVILFYSGFSWPKECQDTQTPPSYCEMEIDGELKVVEWNREHIWSKSRGDFEIKEGTTSVLDMGAHTDGHHLVAAESRMNSKKNNRLFEDCNDGDDTNVEDIGYGNFTCNDWEFEPRDEVKGDVARMILYMAVRYEGEEGDMVDLEVLNDPDATKSVKDPVYGDLDDLLRWHMEDPVSEWEIARNEVIFSYQGNRNPFIDMPDLVELIWGNPEDYN